MKKIKNNNITKIVILLIFLLLVIIINVLYRYVLIKEGITTEYNLLQTDGDNQKYYILFQNTTLCLTDNKISGQRIVLSDFYNYPNNPNAKWKFYRNTDNTYMIKNYVTNRYLSFKQDSDGNTYVVSYATTTNIEQNSNIWRLRYSPSDYYKNVIPLMLISNNSVISQKDENTLLKRTLTNTTTLDNYIYIVKA